MSTAEKLDRLIADQLKPQLPCAVIGRQIMVLEQTGSTSDAILQIASTRGPSSVPEGLVVFAGNQQGEKGFGFRFWHDRKFASAIRGGSQSGQSKRSPMPFARSSAWSR
jgi:hypothetical protein